jgi:iron transport multicopper oxidase
MLPFTLLVFYLFFGAACSASYHLDIGWVLAAPDGVSRPVIDINGKWPPPVIEANVGEEIIVIVHNNLGNETTSIHWHGIHQGHGKRGIMDGPTAVSQCPIPPGSNFAYSFIVDLPGTYWYRKFKLHDMEWYLPYIS